MKRTLIILVSFVLVWAVPVFAGSEPFLPEKCIDSFDSGKNRILAAETVMTYGKSILVIWDKSNPVDMGYMNLILGKHDAAIECFRDALDKGKQIARSYRGLAMAYCFKGEFFLASWCYEMSRRLGSVPNPLLEARLYPGPREISGAGPPLFFRGGLQEGTLWTEDSVSLFSWKGSFMKIPVTSKARFIFDNPDYLDPYVEPYDLVGSEDSFYEVHIPQDFDLLKPRKRGNYSKIILRKPLEERPRKPSEEEWF